MIVRHLLVGPLQVNCYLLGDEATGEAAVIDAGDNAAAILALAASHRLHITQLLNTHAHFDHVLALEQVKAATNARFYLHPAELPILRAVPHTVQLWLGQDVPPPPEPDVLLQAGDTVRIGQHELRVALVPGHSPGSIAFVDDAHRRVFAGDTLFAGSVGRTDLPGGSLPTLLRAIADHLLTLPDDYEVLPGHGPFTTIGHERRTNPFLATHQPEPD